MNHAKTVVWSLVGMLLAFGFPLGFNVEPQYAGYFVALGVVFTAVLVVTLCRWSRDYQNELKLREDAMASSIVSGDTQKDDA